jgi:hypothetical protein
MAEPDLQLDLQFDTDDLQPGSTWEVVTGHAVIALAPQEPTRKG